MATMRQLVQTTLTPAVTKLIMDPLPANLPPPPPGLGYEVVATPEGGAVRTGNLIPTGITDKPFYEGAAFQQFLGFGALVAGVGGGEALAAAPLLVQKAAPIITSRLTGGTPWGFGMTSPQGFQDYLVQAARRRLLTQARTGLGTLARTYLRGSVALPPILARWSTLRSLPSVLAGQALGGIFPSWLPRLR
jgi:hypothetical protein